MLSVSRKGQSRKDYANRRPCKAYARGKLRKNLGQNEYQIKICNYAHSVYCDINQANRHSEFIGKIGSVACAFQKLLVLSYASAIHKKADDKRANKENRKEHVYKSAISIRKRIIFGIFYHCIGRQGDSKRFIHKRIDKNSKQSDSKPRLVKTVSAMHRGSTRQKR